MLVDSCSFELICVLVDQYVIQYFLVCQYLHSFPISVSVLFFLHNLERRASQKVKKALRHIFQEPSLQQCPLPKSIPCSLAPHPEHGEGRREGRGRGELHQTGSGSFLQTGKQGTGEQTLPEPLLTQRPALTLLYLKAEYQKIFLLLV